MAHLPLHCCDGSRRGWGDEPVRNTQAMLLDDPEPEDEPDDEPKPRPDDEPEPDDERDDEPEPDVEPGTLYFGKDDGWTARSC
jgi:hypothetical protein